MSEEQFFSELQAKTEKVFEKSEVYSKNKNKNWFYSICNGPILRNMPIVCGLNWGVSQSKDFKGHNPQNIYPKDIDTNTWPFKTHVNRYLPEYFDYSFDEINYSNQCFFRTPDTKYLSYKDWRDAIPLFKLYVDYIDPPYIIMLGVPRHLDGEELKGVEKKEYSSNGVTKRSFVRTGILFGQYKFGSVPHSAAYISPETH